MKGNSSELVPRISSSLEKVARNWLERLSVRRLFRSRDQVFTMFLIEYMELAKDIEYWDIRLPAIRVPPSMEVPLGLFQTLFLV